MGREQRAKPETGTLICFTHITVAETSDLTAKQDPSPHFPGLSPRFVSFKMLITKRDIRVY